MTEGVTETERERSQEAERGVEADKTEEEVIPEIGREGDTMTGHRRGHHLETKRRSTKRTKRRKVESRWKRKRNSKWLLV